MWGQGLADKDKFTALLARSLGAVHGMRGSVIVNRARSGAAIQDKGTEREDFLDTFPRLFKTRGQRARFRAGSDESPATDMFGEIPATFPTVRWQVDAVPQAVGKKIDVVLVSGGANDIGFDQVVSPREFPGAFIQEFDGKIRKICHDDVLELIRRIRAKCPNAVILQFGYFAPLSYSSNDKKIKDFFKHEYDNDVKWWINEQFDTADLEFVHEDLVDVDRQILEAKVRSVWAQGRAQHWMRLAVTKANRNAAVRGPGVLFVPSGLAPENSAMATCPFLYEDYTDPTSDSPRVRRRRECPREQLLDQLHNARTVLQTPVTAAGQFTALRDALMADGPESLVEALTETINHNQNNALRKQAAAALGREINRIQRALIASFLHPNKEGARHYATIALARYTEHRELVADIKRYSRPGRRPAALPSGQERFEDKLVRFGMRSAGSLLADIGHSNVDAISLLVVTARDADLSLTPHASLIIETRTAAGVKGQRRYLLNFPYRLNIVPATHPPTVVVKKFYPHFEPAATNRFTIDTANGLRLEDIVGVKIELGPDQLAGQLLQGPHGTIWRPLRVEMEINGQKVLDMTFRTKEVRPGGVLNLNYPPKAPDNAPIAARAAVSDGDTG